MAETQAKPENTVIVSTNEPKQPNPIFQHFQNLWLGFQQQLKPKPKADDVVVVVAAEEPAIRTALEEKESSEQKPDLVKFGDSRPIVPPPLKLEAEELEQSSSPTVRWQVYALGGFIILRWVWARWRERRPKNESSDEEPPPTDD